MDSFSENNFVTSPMVYDHLYKEQLEQVDELKKMDSHLQEDSFESSIISNYQGSMYGGSSDDFSMNSGSIYDPYSSRELSLYFDDNYIDDNFSDQSRYLYNGSTTDSSLFFYDDRTTTSGSYSGHSGSTPDSIQSSSNDVIVEVKTTQDIRSNNTQKPRNGILKYKDVNKQRNFEEDDGICETTITQRTIDKIRECELEDVLQYARDIIKPDPTAKVTFCTQPVKVVHNTFRHLMSVKETSSKTGAFKYRTICITRTSDEDLGISLRHGDGWEKKEGIYISRVALGTIFDQYEALTVGDELMLVNKVNVKKMSVNDVIRLIHIPTKLSITVKVLTPFSRRRFDCGMDALKNTGGVKQSKQKVIAGSHNKGTSYKVAQLKIDNQENRILYQRKQGGRGNNNKNNNRDNKNKTMKVSPYRTADGGKTVQQLSRQNLSPIRESDVDSGKCRKRSMVRWSDQELCSEEIS